MGRNLFCVHSKKRLDDVPELKAAKQKQNRTTLVTMAKMFNQVRPGSRRLECAVAATVPARETENRSKCWYLPPSWWGCHNQCHADISAVVLQPDPQQHLLQWDSQNFLRSCAWRDGSHPSQRVPHRILQGGQLVWIAPSGGRDRPSGDGGEWLPAPFDGSAAELMRTLLTKAAPDGHLYPFAMSSWAIMPPPQVISEAD
jgi:hypothetical protein